MPKWLRSLTPSFPSLPAMPSSHKPTTAPPPPPPPPPPKAPPPPLKAPLDLCADIPAEVPSSCASKRRCCRPFQRRKNSTALLLLTPTCSLPPPHLLANPPPTPTHEHQAAGSSLPTEVRCPRAPKAAAAAPTQTQKLAGAASSDPHLLPTASPLTCQPPYQLPHTSTKELGASFPVEVPSSYVQVQTPVLAVPWAHSGLPESPRGPGDFPNAGSELPVSTTGRCGGSSAL